MATILGYLSDKIESIQKRALKIIFPSADSYSGALELARVKTAYRRDNICKEYMYKMKDLNNPLHPLLLIFKNPATEAKIQLFFHLLQKTLLVNRFQK